MVNNQWKNRFEEVIHEQNDLESPNLVRRKELASIVLRQLEDQEKNCYFHIEMSSFSFDEELFKAIFEDPEHQEFN
jgi:hypothetical protein